jgi:hypothetical protein
MGRMSVATIDAPEFINVTTINPLISKCEIKVLYVGANRNRSYIDKATATAIGGTLPGSPIVGYYKKDKQDFSDHGKQIIFDDEGMKVNDLTKPYGFVPTNAQVWFQKFIDTDDFGNEVEREYLMTVGYLWTGQYEEVQRVYESEDGNPQSMKLHDETLQGHWSKNVKSGVDFFIINDAIIQNLCILGEDIEPCFEGADVTAPKISSNFSKDNNFVVTLFNMMKELNDALNKDEEGGNSMAIQNIPAVEDVNNSLENFSNTEDKIDESAVVENQVNTEEFKKASEDDEDDKKDDSNSDVNDDNKEEDDDEDKKKVSENSLVEDFAKEDEEESKKEEEDEEAVKKYALLEQQYNELQQNYSALETSYNELLAFKNSIEDEKKDALIQQFYMLSDEDKKDVIENKSSYSLEDIEAKLSVICVRKKVNFDLNSDNQSQVEDAAPSTFNLNSLNEVENLPAWLKAVEATKNRNQ